MSDDIHRNALRAALAVTGRAHSRELGRGLIGAALAMQLVTPACRSAPPPTQTPEEPQTTVASPMEEAGSNKCVADGGEVDVACCVAEKLQPAACQPCPEDGQVATCLTCADAESPGGISECCQPLYDYDINAAYDYGCSPWGPPAPPVHRGITIAELLA